MYITVISSYYIIHKLFDQMYYFEYYFYLYFHFKLPYELLYGQQNRCRSIQSNAVPQRYLSIDGVPK